MRVIPFLAALMLASGASVSVWAADLSKIDRTIAKEPAYKSRPKYCLLVFGLEARTRVWLVLDGEVLYVDRTANGDLTGPGKRTENISKTDKALHFRPGPITPVGGKTRYALEVEVVKQGPRFWVPVTVNADKVSYQSPQCGGENGSLQFADRAQDAPILHFDGPLTMKVGRQQTKITKGKTDLTAGTAQEFMRGKTCPLPVMVGTPGRGKGTFAALLFRPGDPSAAAEIVFPNRKKGGKPIVVKVALNPPT
jgi:hypothetical protein